MKRQNKYWPLYEYLREQEASRVTLSFSQVQALLERELPKTALTQRGWWSNRRSGSVQSRSWMDAGYHVEAVDMDAQTVRFQKPPRIYKVKRRGDIVMWNADMIKALRRHADWNQTELAEEMGVRQQTVSEWEKAVYAPSRAMSNLLSMVAERAGFTYDIQD